MFHRFSITSADMGFYKANNFEGGGAEPRDGIGLI